MPERRPRQDRADLARQFSRAAVAPGSGDEDLVVILDLKPGLEQIRISGDGSLGAEAVSQQSVMVNARQNQPPRSAHRGLPRMIRGDPHDLQFVLSGRETGASVRGHLFQPFPAHQVPITGDGDVRAPAVVGAACAAASDHDSVRPGIGQQPIGRDQDVVRIYPQPRPGGGHLRSVDVDLHLE